MRSVTSTFLQRLAGGPRSSAQRPDQPGRPIIRSGRSWVCISTILVEVLGTVFLSSCLLLDMCVNGDLKVLSSSIVIVSLAVACPPNVCVCVAMLRARNRWHYIGDLMHVACKGITGLALGSTMWALMFDSGMQGPSTHRMRTLWQDLCVCANLENPHIIL